MKPFLLIKRNRKRLFYAAATGLVIALLLAGTALLILNNRVHTFTDPGTGIIVIDPGHGGIDGGTGRSGILEKEINLAVAKRLKMHLENEGFTILMTRNEDVSLDGLEKAGKSRHQRDLNARTRIINQSRAHLFLSLHVNANAKNPKADGSYVYYFDKYPQNKELALSIQRSLNGIKIGEQNRTVHNPLQAGFYILKNTTCPGVIIETAFITNKRERELLMTDEFREALALSISEGVLEYFDSMNITRPRIAHTK